jgi:hypothetical protein
MARQFASPMLSRIAAQKDAEHASQAALESVARLKPSRAAGLAPAPKAAGTGNSGLFHNTPPGGVLRTAQTASSHTPNRKPKSSHLANTARAISPVDRNLPRHQVGPWTVMEGGGNGEGFGQ